MCSKQPKTRKKLHWLFNYEQFWKFKFRVFSGPWTHHAPYVMSSLHHPAARSIQQLHFRSQWTFANGWRSQKLHRRRPCSLVAATGEPEKPRSTCRGQIRRRSSAFSGTGRRVNCPPARRRPQPLGRVQRERGARHRRRGSSVVYRRTSELSSQFKFVWWLWVNLLQWSTWCSVPCQR